LLRRLIALLALILFFSSTSFLLVQTMFASLVLIAARQNRTLRHLLRFQNRRWFAHGTYLEKAWKQWATLQYHVQERTPFFFYSTHNEFEETNIVSIGEEGGVTEAFKNRLLIFTMVPKHGCVMSFRTNSRT